MKAFVHDVMAKRWSVFKARVVGFFHDPQRPQPLGLFRLLIAGFALFQAILWGPDWSAFMGPEAWIQWEISRALGQQWQVHLVDISKLLGLLGYSEEQSVTIFYYSYLGVLVALFLGWHTRLAALFSWFGHYLIMNTIPTFVYGVDIFLHIALFYLMVMPVAKAYSLDVRQGRVSGLPSWSVTLSRRVLQFHLCLVYLSSGSEKVLSPEWWSGNVIWRSMVQPDFRQYDFTWLAYYPWIPLVLTWFTLIIESGYCIAIWVPRLRVLWLAGIIMLHLGIAFFLGLGLFGLIMILLSISAFGSEVWSDLKSMRVAWRPRGRVLSPLPASACPIQPEDGSG